MNCQQRGVALLLSLILMLAFILGASVGCIYQGSPLMDLIVENQTEQVLKIAVNEYEIGEVEPGGQITRANTPGNMSRYIIEAKNTQGEIVFSEAFTFKTEDKYHLQQVKERVYKAVISQLDKGSESSDNVTGK